jgi:hypothetical protein
MNADPELNSWFRCQASVALAAKRRGNKLRGVRAGAKLTMNARQKGANASAEAAATRAADLRR